MDCSPPSPSIHGIFQARVLEWVAIAISKLTNTKHKERLLKAAREKQQVTYKGSLICLTADLSAETLQARREWQDIFKVLKGKNLQPRLLYPARISLKIEGKLKSFLEKEMATHSSVLAWRIPGTGEPGGLLSMGSHRVGHN